MKPFANEPTLEAAPPSHSSRKTPSARRGDSPTMKRWAMCLTPPAAAAPSAVRPGFEPAIRIATSSGGGFASTSPR